MPLLECIDTLRARFVRQFHIDLPDEFLCDGLERLDGYDLLSKSTLDISPRVLAGRIANLIENPLSIGHHTVGWWGHGVNTYAFYFISVRARETVYLRVHEGGAYTDPRKATQDISGYIPLFVRMLRRARREGGELLAIESMGQARYHYAANGKISNINVPLLGNPACGKEMDAMLSLQSLEELYPDIQVIESLRRQCMSIAMAIYGVEMRLSGNERIGMRAMGAAMDIIRGTNGKTSLQEFCHTVNSSLQLLKQTHLDLYGEHAYGRECIGRLINELQPVLSQRAIQTVGGQFP